MVISVKLWALFIWLLDWISLDSAYMMLQGFMQCFVVNLLLIQQCSFLKLQMNISCFLIYRSKL